MSEKKDYQFGEGTGDGLGVSAETAAALSAANPRPMTGSGFSAPIADAPAHRPFNDHTPLPWDIKEEKVEYGPNMRIVRYQFHDHNRSGRSFKPILESQAGFAKQREDMQFTHEALHSYYPSREIIEKLLLELEHLKTTAQNMTKAMTASSDCEVGSEFDHLSSAGQTAVWLAEKRITEARAFLNNNVKP